MHDLIWNIHRDNFLPLCIVGCIIYNKHIFNEFRDENVFKKIKGHFPLAVKVTEAMKHEDANIQIS